MRPASDFLQASAAEYRRSERPAHQRVEAPNTAQRSDVRCSTTNDRADPVECAVPWTYAQLVHQLRATPVDHCPKEQTRRAHSTFQRTCVLVPWNFQASLQGSLRPS